MGLDMYLRMEKSISDYKFDQENKPKRGKMFRDVIAAAGIPRDIVASNTPSGSVSVTVGYWRKANAIHAWFVQNCQDGQDDCRDAYVSRENLEELLSVCRKVVETAKMIPAKLHDRTVYHDGVTTEEHVDGQTIGNAEEIAAILPSKRGFFFGSTDYNEWYLQDCKDTIAIIEKVLAFKDVDDCSFEYHSSW